LLFSLALLICPGLILPVSLPVSRPLLLIDALALLCLSILVLCLTLLRGAHLILSVLVANLVRFALLIAALTTPSLPILILSLTLLPGALLLLNLTLLLLLRLVRARRLWLGIALPPIFSAFLGLLTTIAVLPAILRIRSYACT